jgi:glutamate synthase domain-containing protein 2
VGGISRGLDAVEMMMAGADAVEVGTASLRDPRAPMKVLSEIAKWCRRHRVSHVRELVAGVQLTSGPPVHETQHETQEQTEQPTEHETQEQTEQPTHQIVVQQPGT